MPKRSSTEDSDDEVKSAFDILQRVIAATEDKPEKNPAAVALGRLGGLKGGKARAKALSAKKRSEIARKAAEKRWKRSTPK